MFKFLIATALSLSAIPSFSENIGGVEFQFPPSQYEWKSFVNKNSFNLFEEDEEDENISDLQVFLHREGDALEIFQGISFVYPNDDDEDEPNFFQMVQGEVQTQINDFFPNHSFSSRVYSNDPENGFIEWGFCDQNVDLLHGFTRVITKQENRVNTTTLLTYMTTALYTEENKETWTNVLNQANWTE